MALYKHEVPLMAQVKECNEIDSWCVFGQEPSRTAHEVNTNLYRHYIYCVRFMVQILNVRYADLFTEPREYTDFLEEFRLHAEHQMRLQECQYINQSE